MECTGTTTRSSSRPQSSCQPQILKDISFRNLWTGHLRIKTRVRTQFLTNQLANPPSSTAELMAYEHTTKNSWDQNPVGQSPPRQKTRKTVKKRKGGRVKDRRRQRSDQVKSILKFRAFDNIRRKVGINKARNVRIIVYKKRCFKTASVKTRSVDSYSRRPVHRMTVISNMTEKRSVIVSKTNTSFVLFKSVRRERPVSLKYCRGQTE